MTSTIDASGLTIQPKAQILADLVAAFQAIYGSDINLESNSPDGQLLQILAQATTDQLELLLFAYNGFVVDQASGTRLDQLVALNGLARLPGSYTLAQVIVPATQAVTIPGRDQSAQTPFTVADNAGNQFELVTSHVFGAAGSATLTFRATAIGAVQTQPNTITNTVTSTLGIGAVNNPSVASDTIGTNEETDAQLRIRHGQSFTLAQTGPCDALESLLRNLADVQDAYVVENDTNGTVNTIPAHAIWVIVRGGTAAEIGAAIYAKKAPGCGMKGGESQVVARPNGQSFTALWDNAISQAVHFKFSLLWRGPQAMANADLITALAGSLSYKLGQSPTIGDLVAAVAAVAPTAIVTINSASQGVSKNTTDWYSIVSPDSAQYYFTVSAGNITIV